MSFSF
jgi:hypothetical protein